MPTRARHRLLAAADELFYARGIAATGVDAVIGRAGVALGSLYNNFGGKDGLVTAYLDARQARFEQLWDDLVAARTDPADRVLALFDAFATWAEGGNRNGCADVAAVTQLEETAPGHAAALRHKRAVADRLRPLVVATGAPDPDGLTADLLLIHEGALSALALGLDPDPVGRARRLAARLLT
ncbi:TetR/AcrR family transcriptional regulator [Actinomycetospora chiangmaiensis]|uniref:TetR/AcrR family transcriptional regulator n=1 Tax=Actinomycetospora chiangmaiensis TaxID=402650 RepID=UPI00037F4FE8|nr:TetR/AcrR family transcriptional regulator [Actinomycetospora chiangmaiensis]